MDCFILWPMYITTLYQLLGLVSNGTLLYGSTRRYMLEAAWVLGQSGLEVTFWTCVRKVLGLKPNATKFFRIFLRVSSWILGRFLDYTMTIPFPVLSNLLIYHPPLYIFDTESVNKPCKRRVLVFILAEKNSCRQQHHLVQIYSVKVQYLGINVAVTVHGFSRCFWWRLF